MSSLITSIGGKRRGIKDSRIKEMSGRMKRLGRPTNL